MARKFVITLPQNSLSLPPVRRERREGGSLFQSEPLGISPTLYIVKLLVIKLIIALTNRIIKLIIEDNFLTNCKLKID